jgi:hypothetical protein
MIHGESFRRIRFTTVAASAQSQLALPPLRTSQFPGFLPFPAERGIVYVIRGDIQSLVSQPSMFGLHYRTSYNQANPPFQAKRVSLK